MYGMTKAVPAVEFSRMPEKFRIRRRSAWGDANAAGMELDSFLEGPSFDRAGNLYVTDIPFGRVFRISPAGEWTLVTEYDGWPNGLKLHKDGRIFITDYKKGIVLLDATSGQITPLIEHRGSESFKGVNDLFFAANGDLYFTDQGQTGLHDPTGRVFRYDTAGKLTMLVDTVPSPNGLVMNKAETVLYVGVTRGNAVWRLPLLADGFASKVGLFIQMTGGHAGPDGMALDSEGGLVVAHPSTTAWRFRLSWPADASRRRGRRHLLHQHRLLRPRPLHGRVAAECKGGRRHGAESHHAGRRQADVQPRVRS